MVSGKDLDKQDIKGLAEMLRVGTEESHFWTADELAVLLRHRLEMPADFDLEQLGPALAAQIRRGCASKSRPIGSFGDLLFHPRPPVELLIMLRDYAAACYVHPDSPIPHAVAAVLYFASIAAALVRCEQRIAQVSKKVLRCNLSLLKKQPWVDTRIKSLLQQGMGQLRQKEGQAVS
ncbi:MAG: hypothetical protein NTU53_10605 [Planctomycetota bacterium]|nr:hypothetical protein [Planctomycetota bacterium]